MHISVHSTNNSSASVSPHTHSKDLQASTGLNFRRSSSRLNRRPIALPLLLLAGLLSVSTCLSQTVNFNETGKLGTGRATHISAPLPDGRVLVAGGASGPKTFSSAEIYDPATALWTTIRSMKAVRARMAAAVLADGRVLVIGGRGKIGALSSAEIYDPAIGA